MRLGLFVPCFVDAFRPSAARATVELLERLGLRVEFPAEQTCCGQPHFNAGRLEEARDLARRFCRIFGPYDAVVAPSGSCVAMVRRHYAGLVGEHPVAARTFELCEFLVERLGVVEVGARLRGRAALHIGCHQRRELRAAAPVERLVDAVRDLERVPVASDDWCCGFGGTFSVKFPEISAEMGRRKIEPIRAAGVDWLVSTDVSCLLHLEGLLARGAAAGPRTLHVAELLAARGEAP